MSSSESGGARPKKKRTDVRWLIAFGIAGLLFWGGIGAILFWAYKSDDNARDALDAAGNTWVDVMTSPYKPEVQALKSVGCEYANLVNFPGDTDHLPRQMLTCQASMLGSAPDCQRVARAYLSKNPKLDGFLTVQVQRHLSQVCIEMFGPDGTPLRTVSE